MRLYSVHAPPGDPALPERFAFVKEGFSWPALFVPVLWILWHRLWLTLVFYVVCVLVVAWTGRLGSDQLATTVAILACVLFALEANNIRRRSLENRGWSEVGGSHGGGIEEAEARFFEASARRRASTEAHGPAMRDPDTREPLASSSRQQHDDTPILGLFPEAEPVHAR